MAKVIVICKLPNGLMLENGEVVEKLHGSSVNIKPGTTLKLNGIRDSNIIGATYGKTYVESDFWQAWLKDHGDFGPVKSGAVFAVEKESEINPTLLALEKMKTGFEKMNPTAMGVKPANADA